MRFSGVPQIEACSWSGASAAAPAAAAAAYLARFVGDAVRTASVAAAANAGKVWFSRTRSSATISSTSDRVCRSVG